MNGFLIIDKPQGLTSHDVVRAVRRTLKIKRVGHGGTLDPMAMGVLPVAVGFATRLLEFLAAEDKSYIATMKLGAFTDTQDCQGQITENRPYQGLERHHFEAIAQNFLGDIHQVPPMFSAVKVHGKPLYKLARKGIEVQREARNVRVLSIKVLNFELPLVTFDITCSKGTYIRTLCRDMAEALGTAGHLVALCRTRSGSFSLDDSRSLEDIENTPLGTVPEGFLTMIEGMKRFPCFEIPADTAERLKNGIPPSVSDLRETFCCPAGHIVTFQNKENLVAVARFAPERTTEKRGDFVILKVFNQN